MIDISLYYMPHFAYPFICPWTLGWFHEFPGSRMPMYSSIKVQRCPGVRRLYLYILNIFLCMGRDNDSSSSSLSSSSFSLLCKHSYWKHCPALLFFMWLKHTHTPGLPVLYGASKVCTLGKSWLAFSLFVKMKNGNFCPKVVNIP